MLSNPERVKGIEPSSHPWQGCVIATIRHPRVINFQQSSGAAEWNRTIETFPFSAERSTTELPRHLCYLSRNNGIFQGLGALFLVDDAGPPASQASLLALRASTKFMVSPLSTTGHHGITTVCGRCRARTCGLISVSDALYQLS